MPKYSEQWVRRYYTAGVVIVEADNGDEAHDAVMDSIDEYTNSIRHEDIVNEPDGDDVHVLREVI